MRLSHLITASDVTQSTHTVSADRMGTHDDDGTTTAPILRLPDDIIRLILDWVEPDPDRTVPIDRRQFLSVESFDRTPLSARGSVKDIGAFRCMCRRFAELGAPLQFARVAARFSEKGLARLEELATWPHVARHVKKFSYLVPYFFRARDSTVLAHEFLGLEDAGGVRLARLPVPGTRDAVVTLNLTHLVHKAREQQRIIDTREDVRVLKKVIACFTSLQLVQLLRVIDQEEAKLLSHLRNNDALRQAFDLEWTPACSHSSHTIGQALLATNVPWSRFSSPMLSPQSAEFLAYNRPDSLSTLSARLTCLTLHFDDGTDLDQKMSDLSALFRTVFTTASNMQAVHVGFPSHRPLNLPLEDVFHQVRWEKLVAFGIQGWKLDSAEIIGMALRHKDRLKGMRLRDVLLKDGSAWKDVLDVLRHSMRRLEWVSLRRIGYARLFDELWQGEGIEIPDDAPPDDSDSDDDDDDGSYDSNESNAGISTNQYNHRTSSRAGSSEPTTHHTQHDGLNGGHSETDDETDDESLFTFSDGVSEHGSVPDSENGPDAHELDFPSLHSPGTPGSAPWCHCSRRHAPENADDLGDDGNAISNVKRKAWERWVIRKCPEHDEP